MLDISMEFIRGMLFIRLDGNLDGNTYTKLSDCLYTMIHEKGLKYFVVNLENINRIDENGLQVLIDRYFDITLQDSKLVICGYNNNLDKKLQLSNIFKQITNTNNELGALKLINI